MKTTLHCLVILTLVLSQGCCRSEAPLPSRDMPRHTETSTSPDFLKLTEGMTLSHARTILGAPGRLRENSTPEEAIYDFDFDGKSAVLVVNEPTKSAIVTKVMIWNHGKTAQQIGVERGQRWKEWVEQQSRQEPFQ